MFHFINGMRIYHVMPGISNIQNIGIQGFEQLQRRIQDRRAGRAPPRFEKIKGFFCKSLTV